MPRTIALVSCVKKKQSVAVPAAQLYQSQLYKGMHFYAEHEADQFFILSAEHGLLDPATVTAPYERTLTTMNKTARIDWGVSVAVQLQETLNPGPGDTFIILAGKLYREVLVDWLKAAGAKVKIPMEGLEIGEQLQFLAQYRNEVAHGVGF